MVEIKVMFPVKDDAVLAHSNINNFFAGSYVFVRNYVVVNPIKKDDSDKDRPIWYFYVDISKGEEDRSIEKYLEISGGTLNIKNGEKQVWAFA